MSKTSLNILIKKYTSGKISREEFVYFHALLSDHNIGSQPLNVEAIINASRRRAAPPPPIHEASPVAARQQVQASTLSSATIDIDTDDDPATRFAQTSRRTKKARSAKSASISSISSISIVQVISQFFSQHYKQTAAFVGIIGLMSTLVTNYFSADPDKVRNTNIVRSMNLDDSDSQKEKSRSKSDSDSDSKIESLAWAMIDNKSWGRNDINKFIEEWKHLSAKEQRNAKKSAWYRKFSLVLTTNLAQQSALANDGNISAVYIERALSDLTDNMRSISSRKQATKIAESKQSSGRQERDEEIDADDNESERSERPVKVAKTTEKSVVEARSSRIKQSDIDKLVERYIKDYEKGNIRSIAKLFKNNKRRSNNRYSNSTLNEYQSVFTNTQARSLQIDDLDWDIDNNRAEGEGRYSSILRLSNNSRKEVVADIKFKLSMRGKSVLFDTVKLVNLEANAIPSKTTTARRNSSTAKDKDDFPGSKPFVESNKKNRRLLVGTPEYQKVYSDTAKPKIVKRKPTKSELNDLVARYVDTYQYGDADEMITLFSGSTWTNDRSGVKQMRQDYQDIFDATSSRKMSINKLRWKFKKNKALGTGSLTLSSVSNKADEPDPKLSLKKGKIRLVVELRDDEALISHLYQIFN